MLTDIVRFEWRYHTRQVAFIAASLAFFGFGFLLSVTRFGADNVAINSPYLVMEAFGLLSLASIVVVAIFASNAVLRDDEYRMSEIIHSTPVGRFPYLFGRFAGAFLAMLTTMAFSGAGMVLGVVMPWLDPHRVAAMDARPYLAAFAVIAIPNVLFATAVVFAVAILTRNAIATYAAAILFYILYFVSAALTDSPLMAGSRPGGGGGTIAALLDPFGLTAFFHVTRHWTAAAKNTLFIPLTGMLLFNRALSIAAALAMWSLVYRKFSFRSRSVRRAAAAPSAAVTPPMRSLARSRRVAAGKPSWIASSFSSTRLELRTLATKSSLLLLLLWFGLALFEIYGDVLTGEYNSMSYPATSLILAALRQPLAIIGTIVIIYYGAEIF
ncbi:MAG TPA: ABC transporter permease, partial [Thermoanaerobaculia bacterium]